MSSASIHTVREMSRGKEDGHSAESRLRVLHIYSGNAYGGVEDTLEVLARQRVVCPQMEPQYALCFHGRLSEELTAAGVSVHQLGEVRIRNPVAVWRARRSLRRLLRREKFDVVVCHSAWTQALFAPVVRAAGVPLVFWLHDPPAEKLTWLERLAARTPPDFVVSNSRFTLERLPLLYPGVPGEPVYAPVEFSDVSYSDAEKRAIRAEFDIDNDTVVLLQVGRWEPHKGHLLLLEALAGLRDDERWICWQVGAPKLPHEAKYFARVKDTAAELGLSERVRFLGWQEDVGRLFAAADVYCQPNSGAEPLGLTFVEALLAGLPVVTTDMGGPRETLDSSCAILVAPNHVQELTKALRQVIGDRELRQRLGEAGPARARALFDPETRIRNLHRILAGATANAGDRRGGGT